MRNLLFVSVYDLATTVRNLLNLVDQLLVNF